MPPFRGFGHSLHFYFSIHLTFAGFIGILLVVSSGTTVCRTLESQQRGIGAVGSAPHWQCGGHGFESRMLHQPATAGGESVWQLSAIRYFSASQPGVIKKSKAFGTDSSVTLHPVRMAVICYTVFFCLAARSFQRSKAFGRDSSVTLHPVRMEVICSTVFLFLADVILFL